MSQKTITSFYNSRKRAATDDIGSTKSKIPHVDVSADIGIKNKRKHVSKIWELKHNDTNEIITAQKVIPSNESKANVNGPKSDIFKTPQAFSKKGNASNVSKDKEPPKSLKPNTTNAARNELSLGDIKKKLANSSRLAELRAAADRISKGIQHLQETSNKKNLKEFKSINVEVPLSPSKKTSIQCKAVSPESAVSSIDTRPLISPRKVIVSPVKSPNKVPAYIKHASLASSTKLPLPHQYRLLAELFRGMETVVSLLYNRNEKITFTKLKPSIQEMLKRSFTEKHLGQIKHLVPDFYNFEVQKLKNFNSTSLKDAYELIIFPNIPNDIKMFNPSIILERRRFFYDILLQLAKKHHSEYLKSLDPPMEIPDDKLFRWHPEFELENLPEIDSAKLPIIPTYEKLSSAQDVLTKARELFKCNTKMDRALEKLAQAKARGLTEQEKSVTGIKDGQNNISTQTNPSGSGVTILNPALRNLPAALLEKVKAKQAAKALEAMTRSSGGDQKYMIYSRLPDLLRTLRNIFVTDRKNILALDIILSKLDSSFKSKVSAIDLDKDIKVLAEEAPEIIKLHDLRNTTYVKIDKNYDMKNVISKLEALAQKYKDD